MFTVYVLYSENHSKIYIGQTSNLIERFVSHNKLGNDWTARYRPWKVVYCEYFEKRTSALKREKQLKSQKGRERIWNEISESYILSGFISVS